MPEQFRSTSNAQGVLEKLSRQDVASWNRMMASCIKQQHAEDALEVFWGMEQNGVTPDAATYANAFKACAILGSLETGQQIHACAMKDNAKQNLVMANSLLNMYAKCGDLFAALHLFVRMPERNLVSWNSLIAGYTQCGNSENAFDLFGEMILEDVKPNEMSFASILKACSNLEALEEGKHIHAVLTKLGLDLNNFLNNTLIDMYFKCGSIEDAERVFDKLSIRDAISFTAMITGYVNSGNANQALKLFQQMHKEDVKPNNVTFVGVINACAILGDRRLCEQAHTFIRGGVFEFDNIVGSSLINMYVKCGSIEDAQQVFCKVCKGNAVPWTMMIAGYVNHGNDKDALRLYCQMRQECVRPHAFTFIYALKACISFNLLDEVKQIHADVLEDGFDSDIFVGSTLVDVYAKCGSIVDARRVLDRMPQQDLVAWTAMISGYIQLGKNEEALNLFWEMLCNHLYPSEITFLSVLNACANLAMLEDGKQIYFYLVILGYESSLSVGNAIIDFYAKCGCLDEACLILDTMPEWNFISWSAMIAGYAQHGCSKEAFQLLFEMQLDGVKFDGITFVGILCACSHDGLMNEGFHCFDFMDIEPGVEPSEVHYTCMVDLLGRAGCLEEAEFFIARMPIEPTVVIWKTLLAACCTHGFLDIAVHAAASILKLEPHNTAACVLLSNTYAVYDS